MNKTLYLAVILFFNYLFCISQADTSTFKAQFALGVNNPSSDGFVANFEPQTVNFPTVNLGIQYMFMPKIGAKLDYGFNRFSNADDTPEFKVNYTRVNLQLVGDLSRLIPINRVGTFIHAGPGYSMIKPLGDYTENDTAFLNAMGGIEFHYGISETVSLYLDGSYIMGFADEFDPFPTGFGSFNGDLITVTLGLSISLSGCYYCN